MSRWPEPRVPPDQPMVQDMSVQFGQGKFSARMIPRPHEPPLLPSPAPLETTQPRFGEGKGFPWSKTPRWRDEKDTWSPMVGVVRRSVKPSSPNGGNSSWFSPGTEQTEQTEQSEAPVSPAALGSSPAESRRIQSARSARNYIRQAAKHISRAGS